MTEIENDVFQLFSLRPVLLGEKRWIIGFFIIVMQGSAHSSSYLTSFLFICMCEVLKLLSWWLEILRSAWRETNLESIQQECCRFWSSQVPIPFHFWFQESAIWETTWIHISCWKIRWSCGQKRLYTVSFCTLFQSILGLESFGDNHSYSVASWFALHRAHFENNLEGKPNPKDSSLKYKKIGLVCSCYTAITKAE